MPTTVEFGFDTFGDVQSSLAGTPLSHAQTIRNVVDEAVLAEKVGFDVFGVGEHHRAEYSISAPDMVLATIAGRTERIKLTPSVIVLSSDDPVRVFERMSTLHALSGGRAEIMVGRGSFTESFPLFGYDLQDYDELFDEKLQLLRTILDADAAGESVTWEGDTRASLSNVRLYPPTDTPLPAWIAAGGSPQSALRAAQQRFPLMLAVLSGNARNFRKYIRVYREATEQLGHPQLPVGAEFYSFVAETDREAQKRMFPYWEESQLVIGKDRGWPAPTMMHFMNGVHNGHLHVGSPETVAYKVANSIRQLDLDRFTFKGANGPMPHEYTMESIELIGTRVIPRVRELLNRN